MAGVSTRPGRVNKNSFSKYTLQPLPILLFIISGSLEQPVLEEYLKDRSAVNENVKLEEAWIKGVARSRWEDTIGERMIPELHSERHIFEDRLSRPFKHHPVHRLYSAGSEDDVDSVLNLLPVPDGDTSVKDVSVAGDMSDGVEVSDPLNSSVPVAVQVEGVRSKVVGDEVVSWGAAAQQDLWSLCQLPLFLVLFAVIGVLAVTFIVLIWLKRQMLQSEKEKKMLPGLEPGSSANTTAVAGSATASSACPCISEAAEDRWILHTVINLKPSEEVDPTTVQVQPQESGALPPVGVLAKKSDEVVKRPEAVRIKAKGLLERRGSSASLTIDLPQTTTENTPTHIVTPTRECTSEEFLLSAGNVLSRQQLRNCLKNTQALHHEFWEIPLNHPENCTVTGCGLKNRYRSILPNDRTRVKLEGPEESPLDQYINANYVRGYDGEEKAYIATQGPLSNTIQDFYHMVLDNRCPIVVMMTKLCEKGKPKCELYFPLEEDESTVYGDVTVTVSSVQAKQGYTVRELVVEYKEETRRLLHYWYDSWPDHKAPHNAHAIVAMATEIEKYRTGFKSSKSPNNNESTLVPDGPVVAHCSAGIGRTGCFIAISLAICQLLEEDKVDVLGIVCQMRYDRGGMVQTAEQYEFVHRAVALFEHTLPDSAND